MYPIGLAPRFYFHICLKTGFRDFSGGPVAKTPCSQCRGQGTIPGWGTRSHMLQPRVSVPQLKIPWAEAGDSTSHK